MKINYKIIMISALLSAGLRANDQIIEACFYGDAVLLTNDLQNIDMPIQGVLKQTFTLTTCQAMQLGTLSRGYNICGAKRVDATYIAYDPLYEQVQQTLNTTIPDVCDSLKRGFNILGRTLNDHGIIMYDDFFVSCMQHDGEYLFGATEYKAAQFSLALMMPHKSLLSLHAITYVGEQQLVQRLIEVCRLADIVALKALLSDHQDLCAALQTNIESAVIKLTRSGSLRLNCLEAAMLGTLERGYNVIGLAFNTHKGIIIDPLFHDVISTLNDHSIDLGLLKIHLQQ